MDAKLFVLNNSSITSSCTCPSGGHKSDSESLMIFKFRLRISFKELGPAFTCPLEKPTTPLEASRFLQEVLWVGHTLGRVLSVILFGKN